MTRVVNINKEACDIYIGRPSIWGNPYSHLDNTLAEFKVAARAESITKYKEYILNSPELLAKLPELQGKALGCFCSPLPCHGDILVELVEQRCNQRVDLEAL